MKPGDLVRTTHKPYTWDDLFEYSDKLNIMYRGEKRYKLNDLALILETRVVPDGSGEWITWFKVMYPTGIGWVPEYYMERV